MSSSSSSSEEEQKSTPNEVYFARMLASRYKHEYMNKVAELAEQNPDQFDISLYIDEKWDKKTFQKQRMTAEQYMQIEKLRAQYNKEMDPEKVTDALAAVYKHLASVHLKMSEEDFNRTDWQQIKPVLDSINFRAVYSLPNLISWKYALKQERKLLSRGK